MRPLRAAAIAFVLLAGNIRPCAAQTDGILAVGGGIGSRIATGQGTAGDFDPSLIYRIGRGRQGWGFRYGLNWYSADLESTIGERTHAFGRLRVRPLMGGYGYSLRYRRALVSFNLKAGYAFSSFRLQPAFSEAYRTARNTSAVRADAGHTFVVKPDASAWIDLSRKVGLHISGGYMVARPSVSLASPAGVERRRVTADMVMLRIGAVYSIF